MSVAELIDADVYEQHHQHQTDALNAASTVEITVVTVPTVPTKGFATELFEHWGVGDRENNGLLIKLMVAGQRRLRWRLAMGLSQRFQMLGWG